jgi:hypothetical protein
MTKFNFKKYWEPTPKNIRKFADSLLSISALLGTYITMFEDNKWIGISMMITGVIGKFLSNFFYEE